MSRKLLSGALVAAILCAGYVIQTSLHAREGAQMSASLLGTTRAPDFPAGAQWLNVEQPLTMRDLRGKIVMLDFWTYCCINCMHIIPDLKRLEAKYPDELVVIGVHSAKFTTEKETANIRQAVLRYGITHPVINDDQFALWRAFGIRAWPSVALIDPTGKVVGIHSGEGVFDALDPVLEEMVGLFAARGQLDRTPVSTAPETDSAPASLLSYPGKIAVDRAGERLYISDSNHNRIVAVELPTRRVVGVFGSGNEGFSDGSADEATFNKPQGIAIAYEGAAAKRLLVADTENHAIREINLATGSVATVAGNGQQARRFNNPGYGKEVELNSPWDVTLIGNTLYIAMAGSHQIWTMDMQTKRVEPYAGSGREDRADGALGSAAFAQPSGLTAGEGVLYVADSEVSAVRSVSLGAAGRVRTLAGGELFDFGLVDGNSAAARFQHPLGVAYREGNVYVADTYNNAIRVIDAGTGEVRTLAGGARAGFQDGNTPLFDEPNDCKIAGDTLYIADTNNHRIRLLPLNGRGLTTLDFANPDVLVRRERSNAPVPDGGFTTPGVDLAPGQSEILLRVRFPRGYHLNEEAPSSYKLEGGGPESPVNSNPIRIPLQLSEGRRMVTLDLTLFYCEEGTRSLCYVATPRLVIPVSVAPGNSRSGEVVYTVDSRTGPGR